METHNILVWSISIVAILLFAGYIYIRNRRREKKTNSVLNDFARENNSAITSSDHWHSTLIGIDQVENNKLFFIRNANNESIREIINLSEVMACRLNRVERTVTYEKQKALVIERIELVFTFIDTRKPEVALEFYNNDYDSLTITDELLLSKKWLGIINNVVLSNKNRKKEANTARLQPTPSLVNQ